MSIKGLQEPILTAKTHNSPNGEYHEIFWQNKTRNTKHLHRTNTKKTKLRGLSPRANYIYRATAALSAKLVQTFADRGCHVVIATDPYDRILGFLYRITEHITF
jgi:hypothetical protein